MKNIIFLILISYVTTIYSQKTLKIENGCTFESKLENNEVFINPCQDDKILKIVNEILGTLSLEKNFKVYVGNINNAVATTIDDERLIILDNSFLQKMETQSANKYASYFIIAHEIGHHLNGHLSNSSYDKVFWSELEADNFAGSVLFKLGIAANVINDVVTLIAPKYVNPLKDTHPEWQARMKAGINGYCKAYFMDTKLKTSKLPKATASIIKGEEIKLEKLLNSNIYNRDAWERNVNYTIKNKKIIRYYETTYYDDKGGENYTEHDKFIKQIDTLEIKNIYNVYLTWHDPGRIGFEMANEYTYYWALQGLEAQKQFNQYDYYDNAITMYDDYLLLRNISNSIAKLQKYYE